MLSAGNDGNDGGECGGASCRPSSSCARKCSAGTTAWPAPGPCGSRCRRCHHDGGGVHRDGGGACLRGCDGAARGRRSAS